MCETFPLSLTQLTDLLDLLSATNDTVEKLKEFLAGGHLPPGFPLKIGAPFPPHHIKNDLSN